MKTKRDLFMNDVEFSVMNDDSRSYIDVQRKGGAYRLSNGRFASRYDALRDKYAKSVARLEYDCMKYKRAWIGAAELQAMYLRECNYLRSVLDSHGIKY
jgi:hypothetical protein